ncbi:hypothetical protein [Cerasicoccus maritimus]|uniref:hypothetical protein n=1 Tax=Cerasicoccus maritimus TaxID=490089 RepID=UPI002852D165|nr:hypothetical protein [Cerasicoccus maritimus]
MTTHDARNLLLKSFIGFLIITAILGIVTVLGGEFGEIQLKIMGTTFSISAASICAMACAAFVEKRQLPALGWTGVAINFLAAAMLIFAMWTEQGDDVFWKCTITLIVVGLGLSHSLLLQLPKLSEEMDWVQPVAAGVVGILAAMVCAAFWGEIDNEGFYRVLAVVSIIVVLFTLVIPILMKLAKPKADDGAATVETSKTPTNALVLTPLEGGYYQDAQGAKYRVEKVPDSK